MTGISPSGPPADLNPNDANPLRVLIVDDGTAMPTVLRYLAPGVGEGTYIVDRVATVADGFGGLIGDKPDVCILDHHVGTRTGFDLLTRVAAEGLHVPIVFIAGPGDHGTGVTAVSAGASCYIVEEDLSTETLDQCLHHAIEQQSTLSHLAHAGIAVDGGAPTKAQILSHVAERLGKPTAAILDAARTSLESDLPPDVINALAAIEREAATLLTLANDLNDLSMLESGRLQFDTTPFDLRDLVSSVVRIVGPAAAEHGVEIDADVSPEVPVSVIGDPTRLRLVMIRFVDNVAAKGMADRVLLRVGVEGRAPGVVTVWFSVSVEAEDLTSGRASAVRDDRTGTSGRSTATKAPDAPNIPVALETVSRMGGHVSVDTEGERTTRIRFTVRFGVTEDAPVRPLSNHHAPIEAPVLILADAVARRRSTVKALSEAGLPYVVASSAHEWAETSRATDGAHAVPVLAVIESSTDSFDACDRFLDLGLAPIPIIVVTASGQRGDAARCYERGIRGYLSRPMIPGDLVDGIRSTMSLIESGDRTTLVTRHWLREGRRSLHVLVVDDSPTSLFLLTRMLDQRGHSCTTACSGNEAIDALQADRFDVVLMDVMMPGLDGFETTRLIRAMDVGSTERPLIVGVSAFADEASRNRGRDAGMDGFLTKPLRPDDLMAVVEQQLVADPT